MCLQGKGGYGIGVAQDANSAIMKALRFAILDAINIPLYRGHTVYFPSKSKYVRTKISIFPRPLEFGIVASPILTEACEIIGIRDITIKVRRAPALASTEDCQGWVRIGLAMSASPHTRLVSLRCVRVAVAAGLRVHLCTTIFFACCLHARLADV